MSDRDRDQSVEQWLRRTPVGAASTDDCLDADTLAAWSEGLLEGAERSSAESHASTCARCQAMLAVMARTTPVPASGTASPIRKWLMLLGPAMAAAAAVALWFAVDPSQRSAPSVLGELSKERAESAPAAVPAPRTRRVARAADKDRPSQPGCSGGAQGAAAREGQTSARQRDERVGAEKLRAPSNEKKGVGGPSGAAAATATGSASAPSAGPYKTREETLLALRTRSLPTRLRAVRREVPRCQAVKRRAIKPRTVRRRKRTRLRARRRRDSRHSRSASWSPTRQDLAWPRGETPLRRQSPLVFAALPPCSRFERRIRPFAGASSMAVSCNGRSTQERPGSISTVPTRA